MRVEQNGSETCELVSAGGFVRVHVPVRVGGELEKVKAVSRYHLGGFRGREITWSPREEQEDRLTFRIPRELFRERERLTLEVLRIDDPDGDETLWARRYELHWVNDAPQVEPVSE